MASTIHSSPFSGKARDWYSPIPLDGSPQPPIRRDRLAAALARLGPVEQIAFAVSEDGWEEAMEALPGGWTTDRVATMGFVVDDEGPVGNIARLGFNYDVIPGIEYEILTYIDGSSWLDGISPGRRPMVSHHGWHVEEDERDALVGLLLASGARIVQDVVTTSHSNPRIAEERRYHYTIFATRRVLGYDVKLIERLTPGQAIDRLGALLGED